MKLGEILTLRKGNTIEIQDSETYRISGVQNYGKGVVVRREVKGAELTMREYQVIEPNQLMWCKVDTKNGAFGITHSEHTGTLASPNMALADINLEKADPRFLETLFRIQSFADYITHLSSGTTNRKYLTPPDLLKEVTLPDWGPVQQRAFVSKLRQIEDCGLTREITHQQSLLAKLKQAILQEAIQGKLTADWRAAHPDVEPASQLLLRIQAEKARLIAAKKLRPEKPLPKITPAEIPFEIPKGWEWCRLGATIEEKPRNGVSLKPVEYVTNAKTLKLSATSSGTFDGSQTKYLDLDVEEDSYLWLRDGDILIQRANSLELVGTAAVYRGAASEFIYPDLMMKSRAVFPESTDYLHHVLSARITRDYFKSKASGSAGNMPKINQDTVTNTLVPLPPLAEQAAIVERVEALMTTCRALEAEIEHARTHAAHLLQAVLKEAFAPAAA